MKTSHFVRLAILLLIVSSLSGCLWVVDDEGSGRGGGGDRGRHHGEHRGDRY